MSDTSGLLRLAGTVRRERMEDDLIPEVERPRVAPGKVLSSEDRSATASAAWGAPSKISLQETGAAQDPQSVFAYSGWLLSSQRGWAAPRIDRRAEHDGDASVGDVAQAMDAVEAAAGGQRLPQELAERLGRELGLDLGAVRVFTDSRAAAAAAAINARAFTIGSDIYFAAGAYDPHGEAGLELIAHECAHVAQNVRGEHAVAPGRVSRPGDAHERDAEQFAQRFRERPERNGRNERNDRAGAAPGRGPISPEAMLRELEAKLGQDLDFVRAFAGPTAQRVRDLVAAGAFIARDVVALAEPSARREQLLAELGQLVQVGQPMAHASADAAPSAPAAAHSASRGAIHRAGNGTGTGTDTGTAASTGTPKDRVKKYVGTPALSSFADKAKRPSIKFGAEGGEGFDVRYWQSQDAAWTTGAYTVTAGNKATDLADVVKAGGDLGDELRLHKAGNGKWVVTKKDPAQKDDQYRADVKPLDTPTKWTTAYYGNATRGVAALPKVVDKLKWGAKTFDAWDPAITDKELGLYRDAMEKYISEAYEAAPGKWNDFYTEVVQKNIFPHPYKRIVGNVFEKLVAHCTRNETEYKVDAAQVVIAVKKGKSAKIAMADGKVGEVQGKMSILAECKAWTKPPGATERTQANQYKNMLGKLVAYKETADDGTVTEVPFDHIVYYFADTKVADMWRPMLEGVFGKIGATHQDTGSFSVVPGFSNLDSSTTFRVHYNPEFEFPYKAGDKKIHVKNPAISHPGFKVDEVDVQLDDAGQLTSGYVVAGIDLDGAVTGKAQRQNLTKKDGGAAQAENKFSNLTSTISQILGDRVKPEAKLVDGGVEATIKITEGSSGIPGFTLTRGLITIKYTGEGALTVTGGVGLSRAVSGGTIAGDLTVKYGGGGWEVFGDVSVSEGVIEGLTAFKAGFSYAGGETTITADVATYEKKIKAVTLTGTVRQIIYNTKTQKFSGNAQIDADLGVFGHASATATIADNKLTDAQFTYDSPEFKYPSKSDKPAFKGTVGGTLTYTGGQFSGAIRGTAGLNIPALEKLAGEGGLGLALDGHIHPDGHFSGSIGTTTPLKFGKYLEIPSIACTIKDNGDVEGDFKLKVVNFKYLDKVEVACKVDKTGVSISEAAVAAHFGAEGDKFRGSLSVAFKKADGLSITGSLTVKIKEGLVATGTLSYNSKDNKVNVELKVDEITLLKYGPVTKSLFKFGKQIPLVSVYGLGVYLDIGFNLDFNYEFDLRLAPKISLEDLSLETFEYKQVKAEIELLGQLAARLVATPKVGLGLFALSPSLLRGGGGVMIPITGEALLKPKGKLTVAYSPTGGATGDVELGMALTFGIKGSVNPYAELSLLDGVWNPSWKGDSLADFEIMPPKELFNFQLDLNGDMKKQDPKIPEAPAAPKAGSGKQLAQEAPKPQQSAKAAADRNAEVPTSGPSGASGGLPDDPVKLGSMTSGLKGLPGYKTIESIMNKAGAAWEKIKGFFGRVAKAFKSFFEGLASAMEEIIDGFAKEGLAYLPKLIKKIVGPTTWDVIEPLITAVASNAEKILELFETEPPKSAADFFPWALKVVAKAWGMAFDSIGSLVSAIGTMVSRLGSVATKLVTKMVADGMIGVKRHRYWYWLFGKHYFLAATQYKIHIFNVNIDFYDEGNITDPRSVVGFGLFEALDQMGVPYTGSFDEKANEHTRDRWA